MSNLYNPKSAYVLRACLSAIADKLTPSEQAAILGALSKIINPIALEDLRDSLVANVGEAEARQMVDAEIARHA